MAEKRVIERSKAGACHVLLLDEATTNPMWRELGAFAEGDYIVRVECTICLSTVKQVWLGGGFIGAPPPDHDPLVIGRSLVQVSPIRHALTSGEFVTCFYNFAVQPGVHHFVFPVGVVVVQGAQFITVFQMVFPEDENSVTSLWSAVVARDRVAY